MTARATQRAISWTAALAALALAAGLACGQAGAQTDAYEKYVMTSKDFQPVRHDKQWLLKQYPSWIYMPWTYQWTIGYTDASGRWSIDHGYNGAFLDRGNTGGGKLAWIDRFKLRFYMDHTAAKGYLHMWDGGKMKPYLNALHGNGVRVKPVNAAMLRTLKGLTAATFDASQLMDQWTFNDSYWNNFIGELVAYANSVDPDVPVGYVGGQAPNAFGGYDYAKLMRKVQFLEAYNVAGSQAIARSLNPHNAMPLVTTHFNKVAADTVWQTWYYLAQGNRDDARLCYSHVGPSRPSTSTG